MRELARYVSVVSEDSHKAQIVIPDDILVRLLLFFIPHTFAEEEVRRNSALDAVTKLFRLEGVEPPSSGVLPRFEIDLAALRLHRALARSASPELVTSLLRELAHSHSLADAAGLVAGTLLSEADGILSEANVPALTRLLGSSWGRKVPLPDQFRCGWIEAARKSMQAFLEFALRLPDELNVVVVDWVLRSPQRSAFVDSFYCLRPETPSRDRDVAILAKIVQTESFGSVSDKPPENVISTVIGWIAVLAGLLRPLPSTSGVRGHMAIDELCARISTTAALVLDRELDLRDLSISAVGSAIATLAQRAALFNLDQINYILASCRAMVESSNPWSATIGGLLCGHLAPTSLIGCHNA
jgi:hypothetical protein